MTPKMVIVTNTFLLFAFSGVVAVAVLIALIALNTDSVISLDLSFPHKPFGAFGQVDKVKRFSCWGSRPRG